MKLDVEELDLREFTREGPYVTKVYFGRPYREEQLWITATRVEISKPMGGGYRTLQGRRRLGYTDMEHDSSWAFSIPLVGVEFHDSDDGLITFTGFIRTPLSAFDLDRFQVPSAEMLTTTEHEMCDRCEVPHPIVEYLSPSCAALYRKLAGQPVVIKIGYYPNGDVYLDDEFYG